MEFFTKFPVMERSELAEFRKGIDYAFRDFSRAYRDGIAAFFAPFLYFLVWVEKLLINVSNLSSASANLVNSFSTVSTISICSPIPTD